MKYLKFFFAQLPQNLILSLIVTVFIGLLLTSCKGYKPTGWGVAIDFLSAFAGCAGWDAWEYHSQRDLFDR